MISKDNKPKKQMKMKDVFNKFYSAKQKDSNTLDDEAFKSMIEQLLSINSKALSKNIKVNISEEERNDYAEKAQSFNRDLNVMASLIADAKGNLDTLKANDKDALAKQNAQYTDIIAYSSKTIADRYCEIRYIIEDKFPNLFEQEDKVKKLDKEIENKLVNSATKIIVNKIREDKLKIENNIRKSELKEQDTKASDSSFNRILANLSNFFHKFVEKVSAFGRDIAAIKDKKQEKKVVKQFIKDILSSRSEDGKEADVNIKYLLKSIYKVTNPNSKEPNRLTEYIDNMESNVDRVAEQVSSEYNRDEVAEYEQDERGYDHRGEVVEYDQDEDEELSLQYTEDDLIETDLLDDEYDGDISEDIETITASEKVEEIEGGFDDVENSSSRRASIVSQNAIPPVPAIPPAPKLIVEDLGRNKGSYQVLRNSNDSTKNQKNSSTSTEFAVTRDMLANRIKTLRKLTSENNFEGSTNMLKRNVGGSSMNDVSKLGKDEIQAFREQNKPNVIIKKDNPKSDKNVIIDIANVKSKLKPVSMRNPIPQTALSQSGKSETIDDVGSFRSKLKSTGTSQWQADGTLLLNRYTPKPKNPENENSSTKVALRPQTNSGLGANAVNNNKQHKATAYANSVATIKPMVSNLSQDNTEQIGNVLSNKLSRSGSNASSFREKFSIKDGSPAKDYKEHIQSERNDPNTSGKHQSR